MADESATPACKRSGHHGSCRWRYCQFIYWFVLNILFAEIAAKQYGPVSILIPNITTVNLTIITIAAIRGALTCWRHAGLFTILLTSGALGLIFGG